MLILGIETATEQIGVALGIAQEDARLIMICDKRWKYWHAEGFRPMLFDLQSDPHELNDLGADPDLGRQAGVVEVEHDPLALAQHAEDRTVERVKRDRELLAIGVAHDHALVGLRVVGPDHSLHGAPRSTAFAPCLPSGRRCTR